MVPLAVICFPFPLLSNEPLSVDKYSPSVKKNDIKIIYKIKSWLLRKVYSLGWVKDEEFTLQKTASNNNF